MSMYRVVLQPVCRAFGGWVSDPDRVERSHLMNTTDTLAVLQFDDNGESTGKTLSQTYLFLCLGDIVELHDDQGSIGHHRVLDVMDAEVAQ